MSRGSLEQFLRDLERLRQARRMYPAGHGYTATAAEMAVKSLRQWGRPVRMSLVGEDLLVEDKSVHDFGSRLNALAASLRQNGWEGVRISHSCGASDLLEWVDRSQSGLQGAYSGTGIVAGRLDLETSPSHGQGAGQGDGAEGGYQARLADANDALAELGRLQPGALEQARGVVRDVSRRLGADGDLIGAVRQLKQFDEYTYTHALNVSILALAMARRLGLTTDLAETIALAGLCHDVGKAKVPLEILNKPGKLDADEWQVMCGHPTEGAATLLALPGGVHPLLPTIAYQHHMGADASGYPSLPVGPAPHPASLLVQVADVFDALRTIRPYRSTLSEAEAVTILLGDMNAGKLQRRSVDALVGILNLVGPGTGVELSDGRRAVVLAASTEGALQPLLETDAGDILDLTDPTLPAIAAIRAGGEAAEPAP